jgi:hypothetical protein
MSIAIFGLFQAIYMANAGGAWDNAKKLVEVDFNEKNTDLHAASVIGDTVGDPFKDTSSVALNPIIKFSSLFGLLAVEIAIKIKQASIKTGAFDYTLVLGVILLIISLTFVWKSFYAMRIPQDNVEDDYDLPKIILLSGLALLVIFEEWLWNMLTVAGQWLERVINLEKIDNWLINTSPKLALLALSAPVLIIAPFNLIAFDLLSHGAITQAILVELAIKLTATFLIARVFRLVKTALLTFAWFAAFYHSMLRLLSWAHEKIHQTAIYRLSLQVRRRMVVLLGLLKN